MPRPRKSNVEIIEDSDTHCWIWQLGKNEHGYGLYPHRLYGKRSWKAHRVYYEELVGPIPEGLVIDHLCRTPACVNPGHLEPVTQRENILRGTGPTAINARKTHCKRGHPIDGRRTNGQRYCLTCNRRAWREVARGDRS